MHETPPIDLSASLRLDDRVAIVTGASSGLGARFAQVLDAMGARVAIAARRRHRLDELAASLTDPIVVEVEKRLADIDEPLVVGGVLNIG